MKIKLVGALPRNLTDLGVKPGDKFSAEPSPYSRLNALLIKVMHDDEIKIATVYPENYKML